MDSIKPASQLPLQARPTATSALLISFAGSRIGEISEQRDAAYIVHAANAYPKLVEALKMIQKMSQPHSPENNWGLADSPKSFRQNCENISQELLRSLGEL